MQTHWLWFSRLTSLSLRQKHRLLTQFGSLEKLLDAVDFAGLELKEEALEDLKTKDTAQAARLCRLCGKNGIGILCWDDPRYPGALRQIPDPPLVLYYLGKLPNFAEKPAIGVVGTRKASTYGLTTARRISGQIAACGAAVVSGMAFGIDSMAALGALDAGGTVVGVLGCPIDKVYPASNRALYDRMKERGCLLSEYGPGDMTGPWSFPQRNRIISGLTLGVLVVEAPEKSGALITAQSALEQNRDVFVVPGNVDVDTCAGSNALLRAGAIMVSCGWDVVEQYASRYPQALHRADYTPTEDLPAFDLQVAQIPQIPEPNCKKSIDKAPSPPYSVVDKQIPLTEEEQAVVAVLQNGADLVDNVIAQAGVCPGNAMAVMTMLEIKGLVEKLPGNCVKLK